MSTLFLGIIAFIVLFWFLSLFPKGSGLIAAFFAAKAADKILFVALTGFVAFWLYQDADGDGWGVLIGAVFFLGFLFYAADNNFSVFKMIGRLFEKDESKKI